MLQRLIANTLPYLPRALVATVARRYIAGSELADARRTVATLADRGFQATVDILGEDVVTDAQADQAAEGYAALIGAIPGWAGGAGGISVSLKMTALGLSLDAEAEPESPDEPVSEKCPSTRS